MHTLRSHRGLLLRLWANACLLLTPQGMYASHEPLLACNATRSAGAECSGLSVPSTPSPVTPVGKLVNRLLVLISAGRIPPPPPSRCGDSLIYPFGLNAPVRYHLLGTYSATSPVSRAVTNIVHVRLLLAGAFQQRGIIRRHTTDSLNTHIVTGCFWRMVHKHPHQGCPAVHQTIVCLGQHCGRVRNGSPLWPGISICRM